jgi:hypothetical protein
MSGGVDERVRRVSRNEDIWRDINENLLGDGEERTVFCECGNLRCTQMLALTVSEYRQVRASSVTFAIAPGHELAEFERVIAENDRFATVEKTGAGRQLAREFDEQAQASDQRTSTRAVPDR